MTLKKPVSGMNGIIPSDVQPRAVIVIIKDSITRAQDKNSINNGNIILIS